MLKYLGILCILTGSTGIGFRMAKELELRIAELQQLQQLMICLRGEIRYMHQALPDAFLHLSASAVKPFSNFFLQVAQDLQRRNGFSAKRIWQKHLAVCMEELHLNTQEIEQLEKLGTMLGYLDVEMQINALDYYLEQLKQSLQFAMEASKSKKKLYRYMGVLSGAALIILII